MITCAWRRWQAQAADIGMWLFGGFPQSESPVYPELGNVPPVCRRSLWLDHSSRISSWASAGTASGRSSDTFTV